MQNTIHGSTIHGSTGSTIGQALSRVDGKAKVTGKALYAGEPQLKNIAYAVIVQSTVANAEIESIDTAAADKMPGVLLIITPKNMLPLKTPQGVMLGETRLPLSDMKVSYAGQHVAVVIADSQERAMRAAALIDVKYNAQKPAIGLSSGSALEYPKSDFGQPLQIAKGEFGAALQNPALKTVRQTYTTPVHTHNPMEPSATTALWEGNKLTLWDSTQDVSGTRAAAAGFFGLEPANVRVLCPFTGGGFGCKGSQWGHTLLAITAAKMVKRPVRLTLTREQMFTSCGHRPPTEQTMTLVAAKDGMLAAIGHETVMHGSTVGEYIEPCAMGTSFVLYDSPAVKISHAVRKVNVGTPTFMRAPGETPGSFALESAMDELAYALNMDPVQLRLANYAEQHPQTGQPWSSKQLRQCYAIGMDKFGWSKRDPKPGSMRAADGQLIGWGMATATYPAMTFPGSARIRIMSDGRDGVQAVGAAATQDLGTGTWTIGMQITAAELGLPLDKVRFELGDSNLPESGVSGGSATTAGLALVLNQASQSLRGELLQLAQTDPNSPLAGLQPNQVSLQGTKLFASADPSRVADINGLIVKSGREYIEGLSAKAPKNSEHEADSKKYAFHSFGAHFVEVSINGLVPRVQVTRVVSVMDVGQVINLKTTQSQVIGGVTMGMGAALMEGTLYDPNTARPMTNNLADYAVCVNPDVHSIETYFTDVPDLKFTPLGCRGVGEIGITGVAAAVANAVYHATGKRVRDLPITPDKLL